jgi:GMP synthase-like glutamine amidotransferase
MCLAGRCQPYRGCGSVALQQDQAVAFAAHAHAHENAHAGQGAKGSLASSTTTASTPGTRPERHNAATTTVSTGKDVVKPIAIFRHAPHEGPGHFAAFCDTHGLPWRLLSIDAGETVPSAPDAYSGLVFMGGPMSVNDDLPWIAPLLALIRAAAAAGIPLLGHCLGGQLMAQALGGSVVRNPVKEIGWGSVRVLESPVARDWFGTLKTFESFHWHGETFTLPPGAELILESAYCASQAFALGPHLALQCHVEMTEAMIRSWCEIGTEEIAAAAASPAVQTPERMQSLNAVNLPALRVVADRLYGRWAEGLRG